MFSGHKLPFVIKRYLPSTTEGYSLSPITATRIVTVFMVVSLLLPFPWFALEDIGGSIAGTRLLSYALDGFYMSFLLSISPIHTFLFFGLPIVVALLTFGTLADTVLNRAENVTKLCLFNLIAMLILMYAAIVAVDTTQHTIIGGIIVLPKWGLWLTFLSAIGIIVLSTRWLDIVPTKAIESLQEKFK